MNHNFNMNGTLNSWKEAIAQYAQGNSRLVFAISTAFAAPLLYHVKVENGGFHFRGSSSIGKSTLLHVAGSVWGGNTESPLGYLHQWRTTDNALEGIASAYNDTLLCLDELSQIEPRAAGNVAYMLANGEGKARATRSGTLRNTTRWRILFLSNGEISLADKLNETRFGKKISAGQEVRVIDLPADAGNGLGLYESLHHFKNGAEFADYLKEAAREHHGTAARFFIDKLILDKKSAQHIKDGIKSFVSAQCPLGANGQIKRCAARFGLVAVAGELAIEYGAVPWPSGEAKNAAITCFNTWLESRGTEPLEITQGLAQIRHYLETYGESRFVLWEEHRQSQSEYDFNVYNRAGFRKRDGAGFEYFILPQVFTQEICKGFDSTLLGRALAERGILKTRKDGKLQYSARLPGFGKSVSCYLITPQIFEDVG